MWVDNLLKPVTHYVISVFNSFYLHSSLPWKWLDFLFFLSHIDLFCKIQNYQTEVCSSVNLKSCTWFWKKYIMIMSHYCTYTSQKDLSLLLIEHQTCFWDLKICKGHLAMVFYYNNVPTLPVLGLVQYLCCSSQYSWTNFY